MLLDVITEYDDFLALKETWNSLYEKDPDAQFFLSWTFLSTYIRGTKGVGLSWRHVWARALPTSLCCRCACAPG